MTEKQWLNLKNGDVIYNNTYKEEMRTRYYDYYGEGKKVLCFITEKSIWYGGQFDPKDWELKKEN